MLYSIVIEYREDTYVIQHASDSPDNAIYNFTYNTFSSFSETTVFTANNVPSSATVVFNPTSASVDGTAVTMTVSNTGTVTTGSYTITAVGTAPSSTYNTDVFLNIFSNSLAMASSNDSIFSANSATFETADA